MKPFDEAAHLWTFLRSPAAIRRLEPLTTWHAFLLWIAVALLLELVYLIVLPFQEKVALAYGATNLFDDPTLPQGALLAIALVAVPIEEIAFRLWMRRVRLLPLCAGGAVSLAVLSLGPATSVTNWIAVLALGVGATAWVYVRKLPPDSPFDQAVGQHFGVLVWASILMFAVLHLGNWSIDRFFPAAFALVIPQLALGVMVSFLCVRAGFMWAVMLHLANNLYAFTL
jgi:hypothetical protein